MVCRLTGVFSHHQSTKVVMVSLLCVLFSVMRRSVAKTDYVHCALVVNLSFRCKDNVNTPLWSPGKGILFSSEQGSIVTGKA